MEYYNALELKMMACDDIAPMQRDKDNSLDCRSWHTCLVSNLRTPVPTMNSSLHLPARPFINKKGLKHPLHRQRSASSRLKETIKQGHPSVYFALLNCCQSVLKCRPAAMLFHICDKSNPNMSICPHRYTAMSF